jgi:hypothetical protein
MSEPAPQYIPKETFDLLWADKQALAKRVRELEDTIIAGHASIPDATEYTPDNDTLVRFEDDGRTYGVEFKFIRLAQDGSSTPVATESLFASNKALHLKVEALLSAGQTMHDMLESVTPVIGDEQTKEIISLATDAWKEASK